MKPWRTTLTIAFASLLSMGCERTTTADDIIGRYRLNRGKASDVLVLRADGIYLHYYRPPNGVPRTDTARWTSERTGRGFQVEFEMFSHYSRAEHFPSERIGRGFWIVRVERSWRGQIRLPVDTDINLYYVLEAPDSTEISTVMEHLEPRPARSDAH